MVFKNISQGLAYGAIALGVGFCAFAVMLTLAEMAHAEPAEPAVQEIATATIKPTQTEPVMAELPANIPGNTAPNADPWLGWTWQIGAMGEVSTSIYRDGDDWKPGGLPLIAYDAERLHVGIDGLRVTAWKNDRFSVSAIGSVRMSPFDSGDGPYLAGMEDRDTAFEAGAEFTAKAGAGEIKASHLFDVSDAHDGQEIDVSYSQPTQVQAVTLVWGGGVTWQSEDLTDYMAGVRRNEVRSDRAYYKPDAAFIPHLDLMASYPLYDSLVLIGKTGIQYLPDAYTDSPIVDEDYILSLSFGAVYTF
ncbi:MipA/OmpV family protein [Thalassospira sp.]|uniref:MipA/OmpV family protein n=1 Tax=Thalassospira sp. TaxID=1912094 RepID=UPI003AA84EB5